MGLPALAGAWGRYIGFYLGYGNIWKTQTNNGRQKIFCNAHNFVPYWNLDKQTFATKAWDAVDADCGIARVNRARTRELLAHTYGVIF
jgi:hypothetical protein